MTHSPKVVIGPVCVDGDERTIEVAMKKLASPGRYASLAAGIEQAMYRTDAFKHIDHPAGKPVWTGVLRDGMSFSRVRLRLENMIEMAVSDYGYGVVLDPPEPEGSVVPVAKPESFVSFPLDAPKAWAEARKMCGCQECVPIYGDILATRPCQVVSAFRALTGR
jgi:hypothetical protein